MADNDNLSVEEFGALHSLHDDEAATAPRAIVEALLAKRLIEPTRAGWRLTIAGRAEHLSELIRAFRVDIWRAGHDRRRA